MTAALAHRRGLIAGLVAYLWWGFFPLFLKLLVSVPALDVLAHRILWSAVLLALIALVARRWRQIDALLRQPGTLLLLAASATAISLNWLVYTWAVIDAQMLDASLGYFINPLINVLFGVALLGERLTRPQLLAVLLALAGVTVLTVAHGRLPWISLALAVSFALYGLIRKHTAVDALTGLLAETLLLAPMALIWLLHDGSPLFDQGERLNLLLLLSGAVTIVPLAAFGYAARRLKLSTLGLMQYIGPSLMFLLAVFRFGEPVDPWRMLAFACIWGGLLIYTLATLRASSLASQQVTG